MVRKLCLTILAILCSYSISFASVAIQENDTSAGVATTLNIEGLAVSNDGSTFSIGTDIETFATGDTLVAADSGKSIVVNGQTAAGTSTFTLPAVADGLVFKFVDGNLGGSYIRIDPNGTDHIIYSTCSAGSHIKSAGASGDSVTLSSDGTYWYTEERVGTWTVGD
jgi:hypothetical protein